MTRLRIMAVVAGLLLAGGLILFSSSVAFGTNNDQMNQVSDWCEDGMKFEPVSTPYVVPAPPAGATWTLLVLKAGTENQTIANPVVGQAYFASNEKDISHVILCYEEEVPPSTTTTTVPRSTTTTSVPGSTTTTTIASTTTTSTTVPDTSTTTTTRPPVSSTTTSIPTTTTTDVPPPTLIESGDAGYIGEGEEAHHEDGGFDWLFFGVSAVFALGAGLLTYLVLKRRQRS